MLANLPNKQTTLLDFLKRKGVDIPLIQESHLLSKDILRLANRNFHVIASSTTNTKSKGVAIVCRRSLKFDILGHWPIQRAELLQL